MANTLTPNTKEEQDAAYSPEERARQARALHESEQREAFDRDFENPDRLARDGAPGDLAGGARNAEENPSLPFVNNFLGNRNSISEKKSSKSFLRKKGPLLAISGLGLGAILLILLVPGLLLFHLLANMFGTLDPSSTALTQVTKIVLMNKLGSGSSDATVGPCATIDCKFKTPTNELLKELNDNGIVALDENHQPIKLDLDSKWVSERPSYYRLSSFLTESGEASDIAAKGLKAALQGNTVFRQTFDKVMGRLGTREFSRFSPSFLKTMEKYGFNLLDKLNIKQRLTAKGKALVSDILDKAVEAILGKDATDAAKQITDLIKLRVGKVLTKIDDLSKGSIAVLVMAVGCMGAEVPDMLTKTMSAMQQSAAVNMAAPVVTAISAIKVGDGDSDTASGLGTMLTQTDSNGKSPLDSAGMQYVFNQSKNTSNDPTYQSVTPAAFGDLGSQLQTANAIINNPISSGNCAILSNSVGGAVEAGAINAVINGSSLADFGLSTGLNLLIGSGASLLINTFSDSISGFVANMISPGIGSLAEPVIKNMTKPGETQGNVLADGVGAIITSTQAGNWGNYMTTDQVSPSSAYTKNIQAQQLADAETDRATLSPFDPSSPYTFMGTILNQLTPYYSSFSSVSGSLSLLGSLLPLSFGSILKPSTANAADTSPYDGACPDTSSLKVTAADGSTKTLAANIFCQPIPGPQGGSVPDDWNPSDTLSAMESMQTNGQKEIDPTTGAPVTTTNPVIKTAQDAASSVTSLVPGATASYSDWLDTCTDPENAADCVGSANDTTKTYGLYTAASQANAILDNDISEATTIAGTDGSSGGTSTTNTSSSTDSGTSTAPANSSTDSTAQPQAFTTDSLDDNSLSTIYPSITDTLASLVGLLSPAHDLLRVYGANLFASTTSTSLTDSLAGFTLWG